MEIIRIKDTGMEYAIKKASEVLRQGGIMAYPTDTVYGLGVIYDNEEALRRLIELKGRPLTKGLLLITGSVESLGMIVEEIPSEITDIIRRYWPGPLTIIFKARDNISEYITGGSGKVAIRIPGESFALEFVKKTGLIITSTSANPSNKPPGNDIEDIISYFPKGLDLIIDGGRLSGKPSTIIEVIDGKIKVLRKGAIAIEGK